MATEITAWRSLVAKSSVLMILKLITAGLAFVFHLILARQLSVEAFGLFSLALSCLVITSAFAKQGIEPAIVRYFAQYSIDKVQSLYLYILFLTFINSAIVGLVIFLFSGFISIKILGTVELLELLPFVIGITGLQTWLAMNCSALKGRQFPISSMLFTGLVTYFFATFFLVIQPVDNAYQALTIFFYAVIIATLLSFVVAKIKLELVIKPSCSIKESGILKFHKTSRVLFTSSLASILAQQFALFMLARYTSLADVGLYSIALKISLLISYPLVVLNSITAPRYAKLHAKGNIKGFKDLAINTTKGLFIISTPSCLFIGYFSTEIVSIFGESYLPATQILIILVVGQWFNLSTGSVVSMLVMAGYEKVHRLNSIFIVIFTVIVTLIFVPIYGVVAAAWVTTVALTMFNLLSLFFVNRYIYAKDIS